MVAPLPFRAGTNKVLKHPQVTLSTVSSNLGDDLAAVRADTADEDRDREYSMLYNAMLMGGANRQIDQALVSASYGRFQTTGFNYDVSGGWPNVRSFVTSMFISEAQHLRAFVGFIRTTKLQTALQKQDWACFASRYNGPSYADNQYDTKMANYYQALKAAEAKAAAAAKPVAAAQPALAH